MTTAARLDADDATIVAASFNGEAPSIAYWGPRLPPTADLASIAVFTAPVTPHGLFDHGEAFSLFPEAGQGFTGRPALEAARDDGRFLTQFRFERFEATPEALTISLHDPLAELRVVQTLRLHPSGVLRADATIRNDGQALVRVQRFAAAALPAPDGEALRFAGAWTKEFQLERVRLGHGLVASENRTGRTSHHAPPFLIVGETGFTQTHGAVMGLHLGWSGSSEIFVERLRDGRLQAQSAMLLLPGEIILAQGQSFNAAPLYAVRDGAGLNGLSARFHRFVREEILSGRTDRPAPVHLNTWEALYFDHDPDRIAALVEAAGELGIERFVLDDGWFKGRRNDGAGLGDWTPDPQRYPDGLGALAASVRSRGMAFGLWIEPESISPDSDLYRAHPEWALGEALRQEPLGRRQLVLDLTCPEVAAHLFAAIERLVRQTGAVYLKWDFNRDFAHPVSAGRAASVAQVHALYALLDRVRAAHPGLEVEACASGGARADFAMLKRAERIWISDCNDPIDRQRQQAAFGLFFPQEVIGAHVGPGRSHTTGRSTDMETRALTALFGHMGVEADITALCRQDLETLRDAIALYKRLRGDLHSVPRQSLPHPDGSLLAFAAGSEKRQIISVAQLASSAHPAPAPLRLIGLAEQATYRVVLLTPLKQPRAAMNNPPGWVEGEGRQAPGSVLVGHGLTLPVMRTGDVLVFLVEALEGTA